MRILNINIPFNKQIMIGLTYIYGIGINRAKNICRVCGINFYRKVGSLSNFERKKILYEISKIPLEGELKNIININIKRLIDLKCYRGIRHLKGLPVRGQRTKTNAKTSRKFKKNFK